MQILSSLLVNVLSFNSGASFGLGNVLCEDAYTDNDIVMYDAPTNISFFDFTMDSGKASAMQMRYAVGSRMHDQPTKNNPLHK